MPYGQPGYPYFNSPGYQAAIYPQPASAYPQRQDFPQQAQGPDALFARVVSCREEAVAAQIIPDGKPHLFYCPTEQCVFVKRIDPVTGVACFDACPFPVRVQPAQQPQEAPANLAAQFVTQEAFEALRAEFEAIRNSMAAKQTGRKAVTSNDDV